MSIRLTPKTKAYLEAIYAEKLIWLRLDAKKEFEPNAFRYLLSWTTKIRPQIEKGLTARDGIVIVVAREHTLMFDGVLIGLHEGKNGREVIILENPNAFISADGMIRLLHQ